MKNEDNSIHIGNKNKISNTIIGSHNKNYKVNGTDNEKAHQRLFWQFVIPVAVAVIAAVVCFWLGVS